MAIELALPRFVPAAFSRGAHAQTMLGKLLRPSPVLETVRETWQTPDGDVVQVDLGTGAPTPERPVVVIFHGLEGSSRRSYVRLLMSLLDRRGVAAVAFNFRGCGDGPNRLPRAYHSGDSNEVDWVVTRLRDRFPHSALGAAGFSLGGNVLLKYLGEQGTRTPLRATAVVSVPFDLAAAEQEIDRPGVQRIYRRYFLRSLKEKVEAKVGLLDPTTVRAVRAARSLWEFDEVLTAPLHGFSGATDYYRQASAGPWVPQVRVPTLVIHAADDPFLPLAYVPREGLAANPALYPLLPAEGGHLGFLGGSLRHPQWWAEAAMAAFLATALRTQHGVAE